MDHRTAVWLSRISDELHGKLAAVGLVKSHGRITKAGNTQARWLLTQACQHVSRHPGPLGAFFRRLAKRTPRPVALIALARKLVTVAYLMLKHNEPYRYALPERMAEKFRELHHKYLPMEQRGRRPRQAARPGLSEVYRQAGLPPTCPPKQFPPGERRILEERKLSDFVQNIHQPVPAAQAIATKTHRSS